MLVVASFTAQAIEAGLGVGLLDERSAEPTTAGARASGDGRGADALPPEIEFAEHNQVFQVCLDPQAHGADDVDEVVVLWRIEDVFERDLLALLDGDDDALARLLDGASQLANLLAQLSTQVRSGLVVSDAPLPVGFGLDHDDDEAVASLMSVQRSVNDIVDRALDPLPVARLRLSALQVVHGTQASFDRRSWIMARQPWTSWFATLVGERVAELIVSRTRATPKVLVLDCDNTLWGGVAAEDGVGGLACGDAFPGFAYRSFQIAARRLRHRGVLLALASKNEAATVVEVFERLNGMALQASDIAARAVNWDPKPNNLIALAEHLNLGLDSFVFVDDSDHELGVVGTQLPMVRCLKVPDDLEDLPELLADSGLFRRMRVTDDDRARTARVQAQTVRADAATTLTPAEYLASLRLHVHYRTLDASTLARVAQLVNKSNQFNVTTIRRSEAELARLIDDPGVHVSTVDVEDAYGEYGLVGVAIVRKSGGVAEIDTFLMSCRVLGRGVETAHLALTIADVRSRWSVEEIVGRYVPTTKNALVADLFERHGFAPGGPNRWVLGESVDLPVPSHITVIAR